MSALVWLQPLLEWIAAHPRAAGVTLALVAFSESLALVGLFVPGAVIMFAAGALIGTGHLSLAPMIAWAALGAVAGDAVSFWLGRRYGVGLARVWPLSRYPALFDRAVGFSRRHGGKSVFIGRFIGPLRPVVPAAAGMLGMPTARFLVIAIVSGLLWAPAYLIPGMVFAASLAVAAAVAFRLTALIVVLLALAWLAWQAAGRFRRPLGMWARRSAARLPPALLPLRVALLASSRRAGLIWWAAFSLTVFLVVSRVVHPEPFGWERGVLALAAQLDEPVRMVLWWLWRLASPLALASGAAVAVAVLWMVGRRHETLALAAAACLSVALAGFLAPRSPPMQAWMTISAGTQAAAMAVLAAALVPLLAPPGRTGRRWAVNALLVFTLAAALAPVLLNLGWPRAVLTGLALGTSCAGLVGMVNGGRRDTALRWRLTAVPLTVLLVGLGQGVALWPSAYRAIPAATPASLPACDAASAPQRLGLGGVESPFTAVWRGALPAALLASGWRPVPAWNLQGALRWLSPEPTAQDLPALPRWHDGRLADKVYQRGSGGNARFLLRAWEARGGEGDNAWLLWVVREMVVPAWPLALVRERPAPEALPTRVLTARGRFCVAPP